MKSTPKSKLYTLQAGRALAAQFVVLYHVDAVMGSRLGQSLDSSFMKAGDSGVEFFFVLSGFIMAHVHWGDVGKPGTAPRYFYNRLVRIYPIFWIVLSLTALGQVAVGQVEPGLSDPVSIIRAILLLPFDGLPPVSVAWTLSHEVLFYAVLGMALILGRVGLFALGLWWALCVLLLFRGGQAEFPMSFLFSPYNILFGFGMLAARQYQQMTAFVAVSGFVGGIVVFGVTILFDGTLPPHLRPLCYGIGALGIIAGAARLEVLGLLKPSRVLVYFGDASYSTYLIHSLAIATGAAFLTRTGLAQEASTLQVAGALLIVGNAAGIVLYQFVERPLLRWVKTSITQRVF